MLTEDQAVQFSIRDDAEDPAWDEFLARCPGGHHVQTSLWGRVKAPLGWRAVRIVATADGMVVGGAQLLVRPLAFSRMIAYVPKGPVWAFHDESPREGLVDLLCELMGDYRIEHLTVQPPNNGDGLVPGLLRRGFRPSVGQVAPSATVRIDLRPELDDLLAAMKRNYRRYIRHGLRQGVTTRPGDEADLPTFHRLLEMTGERQGFTPYRLDHFVNMWRVLRPPGHIELMMTEYQDEPVCAQLVVAFGDAVHTKTAGWSGEYSSLGPNYVMDWATITWARENGYAWYDLEGIDPAAAALLARGLSLPPEMRNHAFFHKLGFGGRVEVFPSAYVQISNPLLRWGQTALLPWVIDRPAVQNLLNRLRTG